MKSEEELYNILHNEIYNHLNIISLVQFIHSNESTSSLPMQEFSQELINQLCGMFYHYVDSNRRQPHDPESCNDTCERCITDRFDTMSRKILIGMRNYMIDVMDANELYESTEEE